MDYFLSTFTFFYFLNSACISKDLPSFITKCKQLYPEINNCMLQRAEELRVRLEHGISELELPPLKPLNLPKFEMQEANGGAVTFNAKFENLVIDYVTDFQIPHFDFDIEHGRIDFILVFPKLRMRSTYTLNGKILIFQLYSQGNADVNLTNVHEDHHVNTKIVTKNAKRYLDISEDNATLTMSLSGIYLDNIFKENEEMTQEINKYLNSNLKEIEEDLAPLIAETIEDFGRAVVKRVFELFSLEELFD